MKTRKKLGLLGRLFGKAKVSTELASNESAKVLDKHASAQTLSQAVVDKSTQVSVAIQDVLIHDLCLLFNRYRKYNPLQIKTRFLRSLMRADKSNSFLSYEEVELTVLSRLSIANIDKVGFKLASYLKSGNHSKDRTHIELKEYFYQCEDDEINTRLKQELRLFEKEYQEVKQFVLLAKQDGMTFEKLVMNNAELALAYGLETDQVALKDIQSLNQAALDQLKKAINQAVVYVQSMKKQSLSDPFDMIDHEKEMGRLSRQMDAWLLMSSLSDSLIETGVPEDVVNTARSEDISNAINASRDFVSQTGAEFSGVHSSLVSKTVSLPGVPDDGYDANPVSPLSHSAQAKHVSPVGDSEAYQSFRDALQKRIEEYEAKVKSRWSFCGLRKQSKNRKEQIQQLFDSIATLEKDANVVDKTAAFIAKTQESIAAIQQDHRGSSRFFKRYVTKSNLAVACEQALQDVAKKLKSA